MPAGIPHRNQWNKPGRFAVAIFEVQRLSEIDPDSTDPARLELHPQFATWDALIQQIMLALEREVRSGESGTSLYADSLATALAAHLLTRYSSRTRRLPEAHPCKVRARRATDFIQDNLDQDLTLSAIASTVHLSDYHFARMFRRTMGVAPHQFLIRCRIERAQHLLRTTDLALEEIAYCVGFSSASQLTVHFRRLLGTSPARFRAAVE
jgi:AraC family transcriptional regulator